MELVIKNNHPADVELLTSSSRSKVGRRLLRQNLDGVSRYGRGASVNVQAAKVDVDQPERSFPLHEEGLTGLPSRVLLHEFGKSSLSRAEVPLVAFIPDENIVSTLHSKRNELQEKLSVLQKSMEELKTLKSHAINETARFESHILSRISDLTQQRETMMELQRDLAGVDRLEARIQRAKEKVEECQNRLTHVSQQVRIQENDNKQRKVRIQYVKRGTFIGLLVILALCAVMQSWLRDKTPRDSFYSITDCLQDLNAC